MRLSMKAILVVASIALAAAASAQPRPGGGGPKPGGGGGGGGSPGGGGAPAGLIVNAQVEQLAALFNEAGFRSTVVQKQGGKVVQTEFWSADVFSGAYPVHCEKDGPCHGYKLFANLGRDSGVDEAWLDAWNSRLVYVRAFKLPSGELIFAWDVPVLTGVSPDYVKLTATLFKTIVDLATDFKP